MSSEDTNEQVGWGWPLLSKKAHFFEQGRSLCGKWMFTGRLEPASGGRGPDDCATCYRKLAAKTVRNASQSTD